MKWVLSDKVGFSEKHSLSNQIIRISLTLIIFLGKNTDKVCFSLINPVYLRKFILSACADKVGLTAQADEDCFPDKPTLSVDIGLIK